jgi:gamma-glutamyltranspeptidase
MPPFDPSLPYPSQRQPVLADNVVATSQPLATSAGLRTLAAGGNAVDAALAAAIALTVVEPTSNGIGGDLFAIVWDGHGLHGLNASGRSPAAWTPERFAGLAGMPLRGWDAVTVPGAPSGWIELSSKLGRLPFARLFEPAIALARDGFPVSPITARAWERAVERMGAEYTDFRDTFAPAGRAPLAGERFASPAHAATLHAIANSRADAFYTGRLADRIVAHAAIAHRDCARPVDAEGQMVSLIQSNFYGFGSGIVVPGTGIAMQNRGYGFTLEAGHPNRVGPRKRPFHTIIPGFVTREGRPWMSFGVMGGEMQPQGHVQMVVRCVDFGENPQAASDAPRWKVMEGRRVLLEAGWPEETVEALRRRGHEVTIAEAGEFGGAQLIQRLPGGGYLAASDHRKDGHAAGF